MMIKFKIVTATITIAVLIWISTRPDIFHPFSSHTAYEQGYFMATGYFTEEEYTAALYKKRILLQQSINDLNRKIDSLLSSQHYDSVLNKFKK